MLVADIFGSSEICMSLSDPDSRDSLKGKYKLEKGQGLTRCTLGSITKVITCPAVSVIVLQVYADSIVGRISWKSGRLKTANAKGKNGKQTIWTEAITSIVITLPTNGEAAIVIRCYADVAAGTAVVYVDILVVNSCVSTANTSQCTTRALDTVSWRAGEPTESTVIGVVL
jgi:hypothetical protein